MSKSRHTANRNNQQQQQQQNKLQSIATKVEYNGPIPPASEMAKYSEILASAPGRILSMAEESQRHANMMDVKAIDAQRREIRRGQVFGLIVTLGAFSSSAYIAYLGHPSVSAVIGGTTIVAIATAFILGRKN